MIESLKIVNFRSIKEKIFSEFALKNFFIGKNGAGKTNVLEALALFSNSSILQNQKQLVQFEKPYFFLELFLDGKQMSLYVDAETNKKIFKIEKKTVTKKHFFSQTPASVIFSPIRMNMLYLGPSLRRDFLDQILQSSFSEFEAEKKKYQKILKSRNALLKAIKEEKAAASSLDFWDEKFIEAAVYYYKKRFLLIDFFEKNISKARKFLNRGETLLFVYHTKVGTAVASDIGNYLKKNRERDILIGKTHIGPHIDDFSIEIDGESIETVASRGEVKSIIIYLKLLEGIFLENTLQKKPILIIDDLLSELDEEHKNILLEHISYYQTFISNIEARDDVGKIFTLP